MISSDLIFRYFLGILEPNPFGWTLICKPEFIEYSKRLSYWISNPDKDAELIKKQYYVPAGTIISHEIARRSLVSTYNVYDINESLLKQFFSSLTILNYVLVYDVFLDIVTDDIVKFRQQLRFILNNTPYDIEEEQRTKLKRLIINREVNYQNLKSRKKFIPTDRVVDILEFHDREELLEWLKLRKIKYKMRKFDMYFF